MGLLLGWVPLIGALALVIAAAWIRVGILQPTSAMLSPRRRVLTRWTARLLMAAAVAATVILGLLIRAAPDPDLVGIEPEAAAPGSRV